MNIENFFIPVKTVSSGGGCFGLELRCLGSYLSRFDGGRFATVVNGDIHTELAAIYGTDRKAGKGVTYLIYGGGDVKLGLTSGAPKSKAAAKGKAIRAQIAKDLMASRSYQMQFRNVQSLMC